MYWFEAIRCGVTGLVHEFGHGGHLTNGHAHLEAELSDHVTDMTRDDAIGQVKLRQKQRRFSEVSS